MRQRIQQVQQVCRQICAASPETKRKVRTAYITAIVGAALVSGLVVAVAYYELHQLEVQAQRAETPPFPIGVDPEGERIIENPDVDIYFAIHTTPRSKRQGQLSWLEQAFERIAESAWYQQLASPLGRVLVIHPGERKEEIAEKFAGILSWDEEQRDDFIALVDHSSPRLQDGTYFPGRYLTHANATPQEVASLITTEFDAEILTRYTDEIADRVPLEEALIFASLLEREAYDFTDMREISGIIWNRLFIDMNLQLDATLQYAKADGSRGVWWPRVIPDDKFIDSPFNTYEYPGLPPAPIANPSLDAILAALNPLETDCLFYFHDSNSVFHCSETYEEHVALLQRFYGQGR